tara:strand:- start:140078 stop:141070 length:993 start_codon:yes stop_codon:yes gene_type:complete
MVPLLLLLVLLPVSLYLAETKNQSANAGLKKTLLDALRRISRSQNRNSEIAERCLLCFSLVCCLFAIIIVPQFAESLSLRSFLLVKVPTLVIGDFAPIVFLGLLLMLHVAGEVCLTITAQKQNRKAAYALNSFFWLPLLFAWTAVAYYLPVGNSPVATGALSSMWLVLLQPLGSVALILALIGPYLLISTSLSHRQNPIAAWIRELRMLISLLIIVLTLVGSRTCFSSSEIQNSPGEIVRLALLPVMTLILLLIVIRLKSFISARGGFAAESFWKLTLWLSLIAVTASFLAFHVLGMSDHLMHVLLNFSLLAIWAGFILPKGNLKQTSTL